MLTGIRDHRVKAVLLIRLIAAADGVEECDLTCRVHRNVQIHHAVTTEAGVVVLGVSEFVDKGRLDVEAMIYVTFTATECYCECGVLLGMHVEVQDSGAVTTINIFCHMTIVLRHSRSIDGEVIILVGISFTNVRFYRISSLIINIQMQGDDAVATVHGVECVNVSSGLIQELAVEIVGLIETDAFRNFLMIHGIHGQADGGHTVATIHVQIFMMQNMLAGGVEGGVETVTGVGFSCTGVGFVEKIMFR